MFKDTKEGQTHYVGDGYNPPHPPLEKTKTNNNKKQWYKVVLYTDNYQELLERMYEPLIKENPPYSITECSVLKIKKIDKVRKTKGLMHWHKMGDYIKTNWKVEDLAD